MYLFLIFAAYFQMLITKSKSIEAIFYKFSLRIDNHDTVLSIFTLFSLSCVLINFSRTKEENHNWFFSYRGSIFCMHTTPLYFHFKQIKARQQKFCVLLSFCYKENDVQRRFCDVFFRFIRVRKSDFENRLDRRNLERGLQSSGQRTRRGSFQKQSFSNYFLMSN